MFVVVAPRPRDSPLPAKCDRCGERRVDAKGHVSSLHANQCNPRTKVNLDLGNLEMLITKVGYKELCDYSNIVNNSTVMCGNC